MGRDTVNDRELNDLRKYLATEDDRERANRQSEIAKRIVQRNAARAYGPDKSDFQKSIERGDMGSPVEPVAFITTECEHCGDPLYDTNRSGIIGTCITCLTQRNAKAATLRQAQSSAKSTKSFPYWVGMVAVAGVMLGAGAWWLPRLVGKFLFWLGGVL